jgi:hypothetical protein
MVGGRSAAPKGRAGLLAASKAGHVKPDRLARRDAGLSPRRRASRADPPRLSVPAAASSRGRRRTLLGRRHAGGRMASPSSAASTRGRATPRRANACPSLRGPGRGFHHQPARPSQGKPILDASPDRNRLDRRRGKTKARTGLQNRRGGPRSRGAAGVGDTAGERRAPPDVPGLPRVRTYALTHPAVWSCRAAHWRRSPSRRGRTGRQPEG